MDGFEDEYVPEQEEDEIVERYRNWPVYKDVGGRLYIGKIGDELYCTDLKDAHKEIDKKIKKWNRDRSYARR